VPKHATDLFAFLNDMSLMKHDLSCEHQFSFFIFPTIDLTVAPLTRVILSQSDTDMHGVVTTATGFGNWNYEQRLLGFKNMFHVTLTLIISRFYTKLRLCTSSQEEN
jgi:hypothetical protein